MTPDRFANYEHRIKCSACGLHYIVLSESRDWPAEYKGGHCPECGIHGAKMVWQPVLLDESNGGQFIFQRVPGRSGMRDMYARITPRERMQEPDGETL